MVNSLNKKIALLFVLLGLFLLSILMIQIIPKMNAEQEAYTKKQINNVIYLTTQQLKLAQKAIFEEGKNKTQYKKSIIESKIENLQQKLGNVSDGKIKRYLLHLAKEFDSDIYIFDKNQNIIYSSTPKYFDINTIKSLGWSMKKRQQQTLCPILFEQIYYLKEIKDSHKKILFSHKTSKSNPKKMEFEYQLKQDIQKSFSLNQDIHKGKIYLMWINETKLKESDLPLYNKNDDPNYNNKYCISQISNIKVPKTGLLSGKQIIEALDKKPLTHILDHKKAITWVRSLGGDENRKLLFITTAFVSDLDTKIGSSFWKILPPIFFSLLLAIIVGFFMIRRVFKSINILANTALLVNKGDISVRSNIRGKDDMGVLGTTFDSMLDTIEKDIQILDKKVEKRTAELQSSLDEKEILLREIHHRVKNNLAMTIELIKIQKIKLKDTITKTALGDIQERIYVMELLHRKLYESKNLSSINITKYIQELVNDITYSYNQDNTVTIDVAINNTYYMDIEYALPCGLIINECVTNSFKHAFQLSKGHIKISFIKVNKSYILEITDTGKGLDENIDIKTSKTLGLRLVYSIVKGQLMGSIDHKNDNGTRFIIKFDIG